MLAWLILSRSNNSLMFIVSDYILAWSHVKLTAGWHKEVRPKHL